MRVPRLLLLLITNVKQHTDPLAKWIPTERRHTNILSHWPEFKLSGQKSPRQQACWPETSQNGTDSSHVKADISHPSSLAKDGSRCVKKIKMDVCFLFFYLCSRGKLKLPLEITLSPRIAFPFWGDVVDRIAVTNSLPSSASVPCAL